MDPPAAGFAETFETTSQIIELRLKHLSAARSPALSAKPLRPATA